MTTTKIEWKGYNPPEWFRRTPPSWMRHFIPFKLLYWLDARLATCWANLAMWKMGYEQDSWWPNRMCFEGYDYCNKFTLQQQGNIMRSITPTFIRFLGD